jgi:predicted branched-subunit amino acid permease
VPEQATKQPAPLQAAQQPEPHQGVQQPASQQTMRPAAQPTAQAATQPATESALWRHPEALLGLRDMATVAIGSGAWGMMTGVAMVNAGMSTIEALAMTFFVYAGSAQLAATPLIMAGAPMWVILATALCVNLRFVVFSVHMRAYMLHFPLWRRLVAGYLTADLNYVFFVRRHPTPSADPAVLREQQAYWLGGCSANWSTWMVCSVIGVALANFIPVAWGLGLAGILALLGVALSLLKTRLQSVAALIAGAAAVAAFALPLRLNILVAIAVAVVVCVPLAAVRKARLQSSPSSEQEQP